MVSILPPLNLGAIGWFAFAATLALSLTALSPVGENITNSFKKGGN